MNQRALSKKRLVSRKVQSGRYVLDAGTVELTASIGMAVYPDDGHEYSDLMQVSDVSMLGQKRCRPALPNIR